MSDAQIASVSSIFPGVWEQDGMLKFANNCEFYGNAKGYERALRDILHCVSLFK